MFLIVIYNRDNIFTESSELSNTQNEVDEKTQNANKTKLLQNISQILYSVFQSKKFVDDMSSRHKDDPDSLYQNLSPFYTLGDIEGLGFIIADFAQERYFGGNPSAYPPVGLAPT